MTKKEHEALLSSLAYALIAGNFTKVSKIIGFVRDWSHAHQGEYTAKERVANIKKVEDRLKNL